MTDFNETVLNGQVCKYLSKCQRKVWWH